MRGKPHYIFDLSSARTLAQHLLIYLEPPSNITIRHPSNTLLLRAASNFLHNPSDES